MKIALSIEYFIEKRGGAERYLVDLAHRLKKHGHEVHLFSKKFDPELSKLFYAHPVKNLAFPSFLSRLFFAYHHKKMIGVDDFDVILGVGGTLVANFVQLHGGVHNSWLIKDANSYPFPLNIWKLIERRINPKQVINGWMEKKLTKNYKVKRIIAISDMVKKDLIRFYKIPEEKIDVIYNGVDINRFHPTMRVFREEVRNRYNIPLEKFLIIFMANNFRLKGLKYLLLAIGELSREGEDIYLVVVGKGKVERYKRFAKKIGIKERIIFTGNITDPEKVLAAADILVHPTFYDACSLTVIEAMASGIPVITTKYNGASGLITDGKEGFVIDSPKDISQLKQKIRYFFDIEKRISSGNMARKKAESLSIDINCKKIMELFQRWL